MKKSVLGTRAAMVGAGAEKSSCSLPGIGNELGKSGTVPAVK